MIFFFGNEFFGEKDFDFFFPSEYFSQKKLPYSKLEFNFELKKSTTTTTMVCKGLTLVKENNPTISDGDSKTH